MARGISRKAPPALASGGEGKIGGGLAGGGMKSPSPVA